ncbi:hypothetical protein C7212DRAFT_340823 [Tuber magnatum]|uniref:Uncharacterized protein n=1 Tax=Tuber magnatum TaxID=42249 RepID=A0A317T1Y4_9PEZI|nr:hypothetical protein C7212DRAFT_340823 [Tuber magnatum]
MYHNQVKNFEFLCWVKNQCLSLTRIALPIALPLPSPISLLPTSKASISSHKCSASSNVTDGSGTGVSGRSLWAGEVSEVARIRAVCEFLAVGGLCSFFFPHQFPVEFMSLLFNNLICDGTGRASRTTKYSDSETPFSFHLNPPSTRRGLKGIIPTASQAALIFCMEK